MDSNEIREAVARIENLMAEKGLKSPRSVVIFESNCIPYIFLMWVDGSAPGALKSFREGRLLSDRISAAEKFVIDIPSKEEIKKQEFLQAVSNIIALGKKNGIEMECIAPLMEAMKKLSENVIR
jgi:hypothetical protein